MGEIMALAGGLPEEAAHIIGPIPLCIRPFLPAALRR